MKVTVEFEASFGHPDNRPTKSWLFTEFSDRLSKAIKAIESLQGWKITSIHVD